MSHEDDDANDDDTGVGQQPPTGAEAHGVDATGEVEPGSADPKQNDDESARGDTQGTLTVSQARDIQRAISTLVELGVGESWSGMLPKPQYFKEYPKEVQERMCRWNDADTVDESKRQDALVEGELKQANRGQLISAGIFLVALLLSCACFLVTRSPWSFGFLALPVVTVIGNMLEPVFSRSSVHDPKNNKQTSK